MSENRENHNGLRVLIVEDDTLVGMGLRGQLQKLGHTVVGQAADAAEGRQMFKSREPQLVLVDIRLGSDDGIELASDLLKQKRCPMIIVSAFAEKDLIERATAAGVFGYLVKPVDDKTLAAQIEVAEGRFKEAEALRAETVKLSQDLKTRKVMDRAKGILMKRANLSEEEAHRRLQLESQKRRLGMAELCQRIIESDELMGT
ncbi:MAG TPA: response regulator [Tepidisphaeraceae bacterium]|jgi:response regulator NasT|nr:response regulator [Tepidisphaeraceae bacterium]